MVWGIAASQVRFPSAVRRGKWSSTLRLYILGVDLGMIVPPCGNLADTELKILRNLKERAAKKRCGFDSLCGEIDPLCVDAEESRIGVGDPKRFDPDPAFQRAPIAVVSSSQNCGVLSVPPVRHQVRSGGKHPAHPKTTRKSGGAPFLLPAT